MYVAESAVAPEGQSVEMSVVAYEGTSGVVSWMNYWDAEGDVPAGIAASAKAVVAVGRRGAVRAYDPLTGVVLWEDRLDFSDGAPAAAVAILGDRVFVAGTTSTPSGDELLLRSYNAASGRFRWESRRQDTYPYELAILDGRLVVAGYVHHVQPRPGPAMPYLAAFAASTGDLLWADDAALPDFLEGRLMHLALKDHRVVAAGILIAGPTNQVLVRAYDLQSGQRQWETGAQPATPYTSSASIPTA
jgi:outer membrane protein assembly factor BamB